MDIRRITPNFAVSPQIRPEDVQELAAEGFVRIICNRPDDEVTGDEDSSAIHAACVQAGIEFHVVPITHAGITPDLVERQRTAMDTADGPVFAYCRSGTRSCNVWALARAGQRPTAELVSAGAEAGYDLSPLVPALNALAQARDRT